MNTSTIGHQCPEVVPCKTKQTAWTAIALFVLMLTNQTVVWAQASSALTAVYGRGVHAFFSGNASQAEQLFTEVIQAGSTDPRPYYFRAVLRLNQGRQFEAENDMRVGAAYEARNPGVQNSIGRSLQRVQGASRRTLEQFRRQAKLERVQQGRQRTLQRYEQLNQRAPTVLRDGTSLPLTQTVQPPQLPSSSGSSSKPAANGSGAKPMPTGSDAKPMVTGSGAKPLNDGSAAKPMPAGSETKPMADGSAAKPVEDDPLEHQLQSHLQTMTCLVAKLKLMLAVTLRPVVTPRAAVTRKKRCRLRVLHQLRLIHSVILTLQALPKKLILLTYLREAIRRKRKNRLRIRLPMIPTTKTILLASQPRNRPMLGTILLATTALTLNKKGLTRKKKPPTPAMILSMKKDLIPKKTLLPRIKKIPLVSPLKNQTSLQLTIAILSAKKDLTPKKSPPTRKILRLKKNQPKSLSPTTAIRLANFERTDTSKQ